MTDLRLIDFLSQFVTEERLSTFNSVINNRTRYITVLLEDIFHSQNASAVLRTCDCFGIQDVSIIENDNEYIINPDVTLGSNKWLKLNYYNQRNNNTLNAIKQLRKDGYRIIATSPHINDVDLEDFDYEKGKFALIFGTEQDGISKQVKDNADEFIKIPMYGLTESFNISVSAAICLHHLTWKIKQSDIDWQLPEAEKNALMLEWLSASIKKSDLLIERFQKG